MSITLTAEQVQLARTLRKAAEQHWPLKMAMTAAEDRAAADDAAMWKAWADIGAPGLGPYDEAGSMLDLGLALEEGGYALAPGALLGHSAAACLLGRLAATPDGAAAGPVTAELAKARVRVTTTLRPGEQAQLVAAADGWELVGHLDAVPDVETADLLVVPTRAADGSDAVAVIRPAAAGVAAAGSLGFDPTRRWSRVEFHAVPLPADAPLLRGAAVAGALAEAALDGAVLVGFDSVGSARRTLDDAVAYAKMRQQFGRPIGSFQAVKHMLVDAHVAVENARSCVLYAAWARDTHPADERFAIHAAKALAGDVHNETAATAVQVYGGVGFTRDVAAHLHVKRARANERLFGDPYHHRRAAGEQLGGILALWSTGNTPHPAPATERRDVP